VPVVALLPALAFRSSSPTGFTGTAAADLPDCCREGKCWYCVPEADDSPSWSLRRGGCLYLFAEQSFFRMAAAAII
jgi:hypothetical protein